MTKLNTRLLAIDIETTGLNWFKDKILEIGWIIKDWRMPKHLATGSYFVKEPRQDVFTVTKEITKLTGVTEAVWKAYADDLTIVAGRIAGDIDRFGVDYIVAHNGGDFDKPFIAEVFKRSAIDGSKLFALPWLDTRTDIQYPDSFGSRSLISIAANLGFLNPFPHSALFDAAACLKVIDHYELPDIIERAASKWVFIEAIVTFDQRQKAKDARYSWEKIGDKYNFPKKWVKRVKEIDLEDEAELAQKLEFSFSVMK